MSRLEACPSCGRHVRVEDTTCPFCRASIQRRVVTGVAIAVAIGATVAAAACVPAAVYGGPPPGYNDRGDAAPPASADPSKPPVEPTPTATDRGPAAMYGAPPPPERPYP